VTPNIPINNIATIETEKLFTGHTTLLEKVKKAEKRAGTKEKQSKKLESYYQEPKGEKEFKLAPQAHIAMNYGLEDKGQ
jgi:hypothetical protein